MSIETIRAHHRRRRFAMKIQQKINRALESFIRINKTDWTPDTDEKTRAKFNKQVQAIIAAARKGEGDDDYIIGLVQHTDRGREPFDRMRKAAEAAMEKLAQQLPVHDWIKSVNGAGALGLATIVAEAGDLANYPNPYKLFSRFGLAPYDGLAGSTWKREKWRPRALTKEEWIAHPFSGERYALMRMIADSMFRTQWKGADDEAGTEAGPAGSYGEVYAARRAHTAVTHPDWTKRHSHGDGLRVMMKAFLLDLWCVWNGRPTKYFRSDQFSLDAQRIVVGSAAAAGQLHRDAQDIVARRSKNSRVPT